MDWADEIASGLSPMARRCKDVVCIYPHQCECTISLTAALRKAKADGMREAVRLNRLRFGQDRLLARAAEIEKGQE